MATDELRQIEREWTAAADERDRLRADVKAAKQSGDIETIAAARLRFKEATKRVSGIIARYQDAVVGAAPPPSKPPKPAPPPPDTRKLDAAREVVEDLTDLIAKADRAGLAIVAREMTAAREAARRMTEPRGGGHSVG